MLNSSQSTLESGNEGRCQPPTCCKFYFLNRWCRYGTNCRFVHERYSTSWNNSPRTYKPTYTKYYRGRIASKVPNNSNVDDRSEEVEAAVAQEVGVEEEVPTEGASTTTESTSDKVPVSSSKTSSKPANSTIPDCRFFAQRRWCPYGNQCRFIHFRKPPVANQQLQSRDTVVAAAASPPVSESQTSKETPDKRQSQSRRICFYYKNGSCKKNGNCRYVHPKQDGGVANVRGENLNEEPACDDDVVVKEQVIVPSNAEASAASHTERPAVIPKTPCLKKELILAELDEEELLKLRAVEITQLKKRFTKDNLVEDEDDTCYTVTVCPTDPDWPYDVRAVKLKLQFPPKYPKECFNVVIQSEDNEVLPDALIKHLSSSLENWVEIRHQENFDVGKVELMFRPFLRWFDKTMEELFTAGLRKVKRIVEAETAGIEFVPYEHLPGAQASDVPHDAEQSEETQQTLAESPSLELNTDLALMFGCSASMTTENNSSSEEALPTETHREKDILALNVDDFKTPRKGTEIKLRNLLLGQNVATIICQKLHVTIQCSRCRAHNDIHTIPRRRNVFSCTKCHLSQQATFRPSLLHPYSAVVGYLDLEECRAFDLPLVDCIFAVECLNCTEQKSTDGIHYGKMWTSWCHHCNAKLTVYVDSTKFNLVHSNDIKESGPVNVIKLEKKEKKVKDPAIQEGRPLPSNGACKHYKKSYRWFRFPCCGKAYPCDVCHDEKELEHEMKYATRVICGFCAKEQPFSNNKPCVVCASSMTKMDKGHWEGGKGCRDKTKMSRDDRQKYTGVTKTVSKKVTEQKEKCKPKKAEKV